MNDLFKPLNTTPTAPLAAAPPAGALAPAFAGVGALPPAMANVTAGTVIAGVVVERMRGAVLLKTDKGMVQLQTNLALKLGASVVLEVQSIGAQVRVAIVAVDQHPPPASAREATLVAGGASGALPAQVERETGATAKASAPPQLVGRTVTATIVGPAIPPGSSPGTPPPNIDTPDLPPGDGRSIPTLLRRLMAMSTLLSTAQTAPDVGPSLAARASGSILTDPPLPEAPLAKAPVPSANAPGVPARSAVPAPTSGVDLPQPEQPADAASHARQPPMLPGTDILPKGNPTAGAPSPAALIIPTADELEAALRSLPAPAREIIAALLDDGAGAESSMPVSAPSRAPGSNTAAEIGPNDDAANAPAPKTIAIRILAQSLPVADSAAAIRPHLAIRNDAITLVGTVVAPEQKGGEPDAIEIATPIGRMRLPVTAALPQGTQVTFEVLARAEPASDSERAEAFARATPEMMSETTRDWSALRDAAERWPDVADALLPKAGQPLAPALLAFIAAVRGGGNVKAWLGPRATEAADAPGKTGSLAKLGEELAAQARSAATIDAHGWQTIAVPVIDAERMSEIRFRFKKRTQDGDGHDEAGRRFVVEATLSALGPLQLDGTVRERHLDLIVRTARALPAPMRRDIEGLFAQSLAGTNYRGEIRFRGGTGTGRQEGRGTATGSVIA